MTALSDRILADNQAVFDAMVGHRFVADIKADRLADTVFRRYLVYEGAFVETAISIFAYAVAKAPKMEEKRWLIDVLDALANEQIAYFESTFAALDLDPAAYDLAVPSVAEFIDGMHAIARDGSYLDIVAAMFAAEWMYWTWCADAATAPSSDPHVRRWVALHADEAFARQARWLKHQLDVGGDRLAPSEEAGLSRTFGEAMRLEIAFHTAAYGEPGDLSSD